MRITRIRTFLVGVLAAITPPIYNFISSTFFQQKNSFFPSLIILIALGIVSTFLVDVILFFFRWHGALRGVYFVIYSGTEEPLCSVINIEYNSDEYVIDVFDFTQKSSGDWFAVDKNSHRHNNVHYDKSPREFHIISDDESTKSCIFFKFLNKHSTTAEITRFGCVPPFDRRLTGHMFKLTRINLCLAYNPDFRTEDFCKKQQKRNSCRGVDRKYCRQPEKKVLEWARQNNDYRKIPERLYGIHVGKIDPVDKSVSATAAATSPPSAPQQTGGAASNKKAKL